MSDASPLPRTSADAVAREAVDVALVRGLLLASQVCALAVAAVGALALVGWQFDIMLFTRVHPRLGAMAPLTAVALLLAGVTLWLLHPRHDASRWGRLAGVLPWFVLAIGGLTLAQYLLDANLGIDELLFADPTRAVQTAHPGRMSMVAALAFGLLGAALLLVRRQSQRRHRLARLLALVAAVMLLAGLLGFAYGKASLYAVGIFQGVALHTLAALQLLAVGILAIQPSRGFTTMLTSTGAGGRLSRRLLPYAVAIPLVLGWLRLEGERAGLYGAEMGIDLMVVTVVVLLVALIWRNARLLEKADAQARRAQAALRHYADEIQDLYEHAPCGYHSVDADDRFVRINDTELAWLGYRREEVVGRLRFLDLMTPASQVLARAAFTRFKAEGEIRDLEVEMLRKDGSVLPVSLNATMVRNAAGEFVMSRSTVYDITQRRAAEQALRRSEEQVRLQLAEIEQIYRYAPVGLFIFDREYRFLRINERMADINGFPPEAHLGKSMWEIVPDLAPRLVEIYRPVYERGEPVLDVQIHGRTARDPEHDHDWLASYFPLKNDDGEVVGMIGSVLDITERTRMEQALRESEATVRTLALTDPLTGLANRRRLDESLHAEVHRARRYGGHLSVVIVDLDHFKRINDEHGHEVGDYLLHAVARLLHDHCRDTDLVARFGGEEFVILMPEVVASEAQACAERIRDALGRTTVAPLQRPVTATFGVAELLPEEDEGALLRRADQALYRGKAAGRNCVVMAEALACRVE